MTTPNHDREHLARLQGYYDHNRHIPSYQRICSLLGFTSKASAHRLLQRLEIAGLVQRADDGAWIPTKRFLENPLKQTPERFDTPDLLCGETPEPFCVNDYLVRNPSRVVMVTVRGESMIDAGIFDGDLVVVERTNTAKAGDFVIAVVDNEILLNELATEKGRSVLKPHNQAYPVVRPKNKLEIFGVVTGLVRRYKE